MQTTAKSGFFWGGGVANVLAADHRSSIAYHGISKTPCSFTYLYCRLLRRRVSAHRLRRLRCSLHRLWWSLHRLWWSLHRLWWSLHLWTAAHWLHWLAALGWRLLGLRGDLIREIQHEWRLCILERHLHLRHVNTGIHSVIRRRITVLVVGHETLWTHSLRHHTTPHSRLRLLSALPATHT